MNQRYVDAGYVMDPQRPQGLVYANSKHGPVLLGAMFQMQRIGPHYWAEEEFAANLRAAGFTVLESRRTFLNGSSLLMWARKDTE